jgi:hypothetical protein
MGTFKIDNSDISVQEHPELMLGQEAYATTAFSMSAGDLQAELSFEVVFGAATTMALLVSGGDPSDTAHANNLRHPSQLLAYCVRSELIPDEQGEPHLGPFTCALYKMEGLGRGFWTDPLFNDGYMETRLSKTWEEGVRGLLSRNPAMLSEAWRAFLAYKASDLDESIRETEQELKRLIEFRNSLGAKPFATNSIYRQPPDEFAYTRKR